MVKDGEDWHRLQTVNLKNLGQTLQDAQTMTSLLGACAPKQDVAQVYCSLSTKLSLKIPITLSLIYTNET